MSKIPSLFYLIRRHNMVSTISSGLSSEEYDSSVYSSRGERLEELLTSICTSLGEAGSITENKSDMGFLLSIVGSYMMSIKEGTLAEDALPPSVLFNENVFPMLDNYTLETEEIETDGETEQE